MFMSSLPAAPTTLHYLGTCPNCGNGVAITPAEADAHTNGKTAHATCTGCGHTATVKAVHGTYSADSPCDGRCMGAVGPKCECVCAGVNHGRAYIPATGYDLEFVTKANAKRKAANTKRAATNAAKRAERAAAKAAAKAKDIADRRTELLETYPALARLADHLDNPFMDDMWEAWDANRMTDRQAAAASAAVERNEARAARRAAQDAAKAAAAATGVRAPSDGKRATHTVSVDAVWCQESMYGMTMKMRVTHADGWSARMSVPAKLAYAVNMRQSAGGETARLKEALVGTQVVVTASWVPSWDGDVMVADGKRPAVDKATVAHHVAASRAWMVAEEEARGARREAAGLPRL